MMKYGYHNTFRQVEGCAGPGGGYPEGCGISQRKHTAAGRRGIDPSMGRKVQTCAAGEEWVDFYGRPVDKGNALRILVQDYFGASREGNHGLGGQYQ